MDWLSEKLEFFKKIGNKKEVYTQNQKGSVDISRSRREKNA